MFGEFISEHLDIFIGSIFLIWVFGLLIFHSFGFIEVMRMTKRDKKNIK